MTFHPCSGSAVYQKRRVLHRYHDITLSTSTHSLLSQLILLSYTKCGQQKKADKFLCQTLHHKLLTCRILPAPGSSQRLLWMQRLLSSAPSYVIIVFIIFSLLIRLQQQSTAAYILGRLTKDCL